jgi:GR25 family glycosyltransferase involved in LPS biosynthesis
MDKIECIYILNLKKERSRLKQCLMLLADEEIYIPIKIFPGIYWDSDIFRNEIYDKIAIPSKQWKEINGKYLSLGQVACCFSHIELLKDAQKSGYKTILLLQDDVYCNNIGELKHEISKFNRLIQKYNDFDIYYLGKEKVIKDEYEKKYKDTNALLTGYSWDAHAVIFSKKCIDKLLNTPILENIIPFDEFLPLCYGKSQCFEKEYYEKLFPKIITAISSDTFQKVYQCEHNNSRYKHLIDKYTLTDIDNSNLI